MQWEKDHSSFYSAAQWNSVLAVQQPDFSRIDGHFVALRFNDNEIQIFTDQLGMRSFYAAKTARGVVFSTRLDWVARASDNCEIDFESFGPQWLAFNQISCWSPVHNIYRLGPGSRASCTAASFEHKETFWYRIPISRTNTDSKKRSNCFSSRTKFLRKKFHSACLEDWIRECCLPCIQPWEKRI